MSDWSVVARFLELDNQLLGIRGSESRTREHEGDQWNSKAREENERIGCLLEGTSDPASSLD